MNPQIIFSDIDGTFLTNDHRVTKHTAEAVQKLLARDIPFVLVSARMPEAIYPITAGMGITLPIISYSGGLVLTETGEELYEKRLPPVPCRQVLADIENRWPEVTVNYYAGHRWYVQEIDAAVQREMDITHATAEVADFHGLMERSILPHKILAMAKPTHCEEMERTLSAEYPELNVVRSSSILLEIMDKTVSKATGIEVMLKHFGLAPTSAVAFGDNYNDVAMLKYVGCSVAMGNAPDEIKKLAKEVTAGNEEDGIYRWLRDKKII
ncbi:MAG: HAD family phosphatase [Selenomonadaceae bacterium]|nr:HAD family phosphatase [Selenomonadaceae bacterium]